MRNNERQNNRRSHLGGFTLVEVLIVVVILGILATLAIPRFSTASQQAKENTLKDEMRYLRTQITVYAAQHNDCPPGYPSADRTKTPTATLFVNQLTESSDSLANLSTTPGAAYPYGPYLTEMPANPINTRKDVEIVGDGAMTPDGTTGWLYQPTTATLLPNSTGFDSQGKAYSAY